MGLKKRLRELEEKLAKALQKIEELESVAEENKELKKRIEELEGKLNEKKVPHFVKEDIKTRRKKNGQKKGHKGCSRRTPEKIDEEEYHELNECPECGGHNLSDIQEVTERNITDIEEPQEAKTTKHRKERKYCRDCKKIVEAPVVDALPNARYGLRLMLFVMFLKIGMRLPVEKVCELLDNMYKLKVSGGEVVHMLKQLAREFGSYYEELKIKIREAKVRYIDETGRRVDGKNHMIWGFITEEVALYKVHKSRGHKVPLRILGKKCGGVNVNDRYSAYYALIDELKDCKMQVCWSHILDDSKQLAKDFPEGKIIHRRLKSIFNSSKQFEGGKGTEEDVKKLLKRIEKIEKLQFKSLTCHKFIKNLSVRDREHLFVFVTHQGVEPTSNRIERGLRHDVVIRKISGGNRSKKGARVHECLLSTMMTYKLQRKNLIRDGMGYIQSNMIKRLQTIK
jgi:transposase